MGKIKNNPVTRGFSGKLGDDLVFRQLDNQTIFAKRTLVSSAPSARQKEIRSNFTQASLYASAAIDNPQASQDYKLMAAVLGLKSAYLAAVTDYLTEPEIGSAFTGYYKGRVGDVINITSKLPFKITEIDVSIMLPDGTVLESGKAISSELKWRYVATVANAQVSGSKLVLVARDRLGKEVTFEQTI